MTNSFFLFGMGDRPKMVYRAGQVRDALDGRLLGRWQVQSERIIPAEYRVEWRGPAGAAGGIREDEAGVWLEEGPRRTPLAQSRLRLPTFDTFRHRDLLRALHHEILINIVNGRPLPNLFVYFKPWYRDAAMMAMCLKLTGNLPLLADWIGSLREPFDRNNAGHCEPDNLGQALYLVSLTHSPIHPLVETIMITLPRFIKDGRLTGPTDGAPHPVYQAKWLKFGLASLKLDDPYEIPVEADSYSSLFWMDYRDQHVPTGRFNARQKQFYPYLAWAEAHFHCADPPMDLARPGYPITWEAEASQADYAGMACIDQACVEQRRAMPHSWHAAEMLLYLIEQD